MAVASIEKNGTTLIVKPEGRLDTVRAPQLDKELQPHLDGVSQIVMDFSKVEYISSSCLRLLLGLVQEMKARGGEVRVTHASKAVLHIIELTGFTSVMRVTAD